MKKVITTVPGTAIEFQDAFGTEEDCLTAIARYRWPDGFICPNCSHDDGYFITTRHLYQCTVCRHQTSITSGTLFHGTKIPLRYWFWMIYVIAHDKGGASASRIASQLDMHYKTVWHILQKIRHAMGRRDEPFHLAGLIELDEAYLGAEARKVGRRKLNKEDYLAARRKGSRRLGRPKSTGGEKKTQTEVLVMVEDRGDKAGFLSMKVLEYTDRLDIGELVEQKVHPGQRFKTDARQAHWVLERMGHELEVKVCSGPAGVEWLPHSHRAISLFKRFLLGTYHGVSAGYLPRYLQEFCFRFNRRHKPSRLWESLLKACCQALPMTYAELRL